jgi:hypothetical protein
MKVAKTLQSIYRNTPTFAKHLLKNVTIAGIVAI